MMIAICYYFLPDELFRGSFLRGLEITSDTGSFLYFFFKLAVRKLGLLSFLYNFFRSRLGHVSGPLKGN